MKGIGYSELNTLRFRRIDLKNSVRKIVGLCPKDELGREPKRHLQRGDMKAIVRDEYGSPDVLRLEEIPTPTPGVSEVLVRVLVASVNKGDWEILRGDPLWVRLAGFGLVRPKTRILGSNLAGRIEAVGRDVTRFKVGDEVFGDILQCGLGAFAEYVCVPEDAVLVTKPAGLTFEEAASVPEAGFIALQSIRDKGRVKPGQKVLINGAGGGAGSFAVQLAKSVGAEVTGVDRSDKLDLIRLLGAEHAIDYTQEDFSAPESQYDMILDVVGVRSIGTWKRMLRPGGIYLAAGGSVAQIAKTVLLGTWVSWTTSKTIEMLAVNFNNEDLVTIGELLEKGEIAATIDRRYPLDEVAEAIGYVGGGHSKGKVVITV
jgi:NADPH:quinone reductase-like Zn-dependent oxidoreductase